jgi:hypothetical protein
LGRAGDRLLYIRASSRRVSLHTPTFQSTHRHHHSVVRRVGARTRASIGIAEWNPTPCTTRQPRRIDENTERIEILFFFNSCVPVHHVTGYHSPTPTSRCVRCVVLASSPSRRRSRSDIPMRVVASRVARRASRTKQKQKTKTKRTLEEALETNAGEATARAAVAETVKDIVVRVRAVL